MGQAIIFTDVRTLKGTLRKNQPYKRYMKLLKAQRVAFQCEIMPLEQAEMLYGNTGLDLEDMQRPVAVIHFKGKK